MPRSRCGDRSQRGNNEPIYVLLAMWHGGPSPLPKLPSVQGYYSSTDTCNHHVRCMLNALGIKLSLTPTVRPIILGAPTVPKQPRKRHRQVCNHPPESAHGLRTPDSHQIRGTICVPHTSPPPPLTALVCTPLEHVIGVHVAALLGNISLCGSAHPRLHARKSRTAKIREPHPQQIQKCRG